MATQIWRTLPALAAALTLSACYSQSDYETDYTEAICDKTFECYDEAQQENLVWQDVDSCYEEWQTLQTDSESCVFDRGAAQLCVLDTQEMACNAFYSGSWPDSCELVCGE